MATILKQGASLGQGQNFLPAINRASRTDEFKLPDLPAQFDAATPLSDMTVNTIEDNLRSLCNTNPYHLLGLAELKVQDKESWIRLTHFLILEANELHQESGRFKRILGWPLAQARARPILSSSAVVCVLAAAVMIYISWPDDCGGCYKPNITRLDAAIERKLHGQPLVHDIVVRYVDDHVNSKPPERALVLSFHGPPGVGKNYVGRMIAESLFVDGLNSRCVPQFIATRNFPHIDPENIKEYKDQLHRVIPEAFKRCPRTLFIFDEADKLPEGLIDTIKPYVDGVPVDGQDFNRAMFLFLSNTGGPAITNKFIELRKGGTDRQDFGIKQFERIVQESARTTDGADERRGMWHASLLEHSLVHVVPFLPLDLEEVEKCIRDVLLDLGREADITKISSQLLFYVQQMLDKVSGEISFIEKDGVSYSENGCRDVRSKTLLHQKRQKH